jgi:hypothetical protein
MISRRDALAALATQAALVALSCGAPRPAAPPPTPEAPPLKLEPLVDLVQAAGLIWLVDARPLDLLADASLGAAIAQVLPPDRLDSFAARQGGVDLRRASELVIAGFENVDLALARLAVDPARVEKAFANRALAVEGRAVERGVTRMWGTVGGDREQVAIFGREGVGLERGHFGPLRVASYFAEGRLKRSPQALRAEPLRTAAERLGEAPLRGFAPGPFEGRWASGLGGLLGAATAVAGSVRPTRTGAGEGSLQLSVVLLGAWGQDAGVAAARLAAAFGVLAEDPLGRLAGLNRPKDGPRVSGDETHVRLEVVLDPTELARGIRDATSAAAADIVASPRRGAPPGTTPAP